jgi:Cu+-exporting ATPase
MSSHDHGRHRHNHEAGGVRQGTAASEVGAPGVVVDPVCGMQIESATAAGHMNHGGRTYFFCSARCEEKFRSNPDHYVGATHAAGAAAPPAVSRSAPGAGQTPSTSLAGTWTCPMHPEIVRDGPGTCPICGMALEPRTATGAEGPDPELRDMTRRFWIGTALSVPLILGAMAEMLPGQALRHMVAPRVLAWLQLVLATPVVLWAGWPFFVRGWQSIVNRSLNMFTLIALGVGTAYVYSVVATLAPRLVPGFVPDARRRRGPLFRSGRGDHRPGPARTGAGAPRA